MTESRIAEMSGSRPGEGRPRVWGRLHNALARETSGGGLIRQIDGLRFFAIVSVVLYHLDGYLATKAPGAPLLRTISPDLTHYVAQSGYFGVQLFFAISGFILGLPFATAWIGGGPRVRLRKYFGRRVTRLEPPYVINLVVCALLLVVINRQDVGTIGRSLLSSILYSHFFVYGAPSVINGVAWSLEVEVQFYILAPVLAWVFAIRHAPLRRVVLVASMLLSGAVQHYLPFDLSHGYTLLCQLQYFLSGLLLADFYVSGWGSTEGQSIGWDLAGSAAWVGIAAILLLYVGPEPRMGDWFAPVVLPCLIFFAYASAIRGRVWSAVTSHPALYLIGGMCYTTYLWHYVIISAVGRVGLRLIHFPYYWQNLLALGAFVLPWVLVGSVVLFILFEKPFMRRNWPERLRDRIQALGGSVKSGPLA